MELLRDLEYFHKLKKIATPALMSLVVLGDGQDSRASATGSSVTGTTGSSDTSSDTVTIPILKPQSKPQPKAKSNPMSKMSMTSCVAGLQELKRKKSDSGDDNGDDGDGGTGGGEGLGLETGGVSIQTQSQTQPHDTKKRRVVGPSRPSVADTLMASNSNGSGW